MRSPEEEMTLSIRPADREDADAIAILAETGYRRYLKLMPAFYADVPRSYWRERFLKTLNLKNFYTFIVETATEPPVITAYVDLFLKRSASELVKPPLRVVIDNLVVLPEFRRKGIAREILHFTEEWAAGQGAAAIELETGANNAAALHLYRSAGYGIRSHILEKHLANKESDA